MEDAGKNPKWNEKVDIKLNFSESVTVTVFDEDIMMDDFVGEETFTVKELCSLGEGRSRWLNLNFQGKKSAEVLMSGHWIPQAET